MKRVPKLSGIMISRFDHGIVFPNFYCQESDDNELVNLLANSSGNLLLTIYWLMDDDDPDVELTDDRDVVTRKLGDTVEIEYRLDWRVKKVVLDKYWAVALFHMAYSLKIYLLIENTAKRDDHKSSRDLLANIGITSSSKN